MLGTKRLPNAKEAIKVKGVQDCILIHERRGDLTIAQKDERVEYQTL